MGHTCVSENLWRRICHPNQARYSPSLKRRNLRPNTYQRVQLCTKFLPTTRCPNRPCNPCFIHSVCFFHPSFSPFPFFPPPSLRLPPPSASPSSPYAPPPPPGPSPAAPHPSPAPSPTSPYAPHPSPGPSPAAPH